MQSYCYPLSTLTTRPTITLFSYAEECAHMKEPLWAQEGLLTVAQAQGGAGHRALGNVRNGDFLWVLVDRRLEQRAIVPQVHYDPDYNGPEICFFCLQCTLDPDVCSFGPTYDYKRRLSPGKRFVMLTHRPTETMRRRYGRSHTFVRARLMNC
jgi:hypothetical protein